MHFLRRIGVDGYMLLLIATAIAGVIVPARGMAASGLHVVTYWAVTVLFFVYGAKLDGQSVRAGLLNLRLQSLTFSATYIMFPIVGFALAAVFGRYLGAEMAVGIMFLSLLPSTVQSSIAFTSMASGNVAGAICSASLSNILGVVLTPLLVAKLLHLDGGGVTLGAVAKIGMQILLPFAIGQLMRPWIGPFVTRHKLLTMVVDRGSILLIIFSAFSASTVAGLWQQIPWPSMIIALLVVLLFLAIVMIAMMIAGRVFGLPPADRAALFFCGSTKSLASGLPIASAIFPATAVGATVLPVMMYHMTQLLVCSFVAQRFASRVRARAAAAR